MQRPTKWTVFDGHNDVLLRIYHPKDKRRHSFFNRNDHGHIDLPRMREGGLAGGFFAVFVPSDSEEGPFPGIPPGSARANYELPLDEAVGLNRAQQIAIKGVACLYRLQAESQGKLRVVRSAAVLKECLETDVVAAVLHFEGADAIDPDLDALHVFYQAGLRSLGLTWSRSGYFAHGVPFQFPKSPDTGPGLSSAGFELVRTCNRLGIVVDLAHINANGFWDVARTTDAPLVVTHSGVHALCPSTRNLTDDQIDAVGDSKGVIGVNFHVAFVRQDGNLDPKTPLETIVDHIDYIADRIGVECVALGSDFDGATIPEGLADAAGLPNLLDSLRARGYDDAALAKITHQNWVRVLSDTWR